MGLIEVGRQHSMGRVLDCTGGSERNTSTHIPLLPGYGCNMPRPCPIKLSSVGCSAGIFVTKLKTVTNTVPRTELTLKTKGFESPEQDASFPTPPASSNTNLEKGPGSYSLPQNRAGKGGFHTHNKKQCEIIKLFPI